MTRIVTRGLHSCSATSADQPAEHPTHPWARKCLAGSLSCSIVAGRALLFEFHEHGQLVLLRKLPSVASSLGAGLAACSCRLRWKSSNTSLQSNFGARRRCLCSRPLRPVRPAGSSSPARRTPTSAARSRAQCLVGQIATALSKISRDGAVRAIVGLNRSQPRQSNRLRNRAEGFPAIRAPSGDQSVERLAGAAWPRCGRCRGRRRLCARRKSRQPVAQLALRRTRNCRASRCKNLFLRAAESSPACRPQPRRLGHVATSRSKACADCMQVGSRSMPACHTSKHVSKRIDRARPATRRTPPPRARAESRTGRARRAA